MQHVELSVDTLQQTILLSYHRNFPGHILGVTKSTATLKLQKDDFLIRLKGQMTENHLRRPSPVVIEIRKAKPSSWKDQSRGNEDVPNGARLLRIMTSQSRERVE
jgi:hypothetical protein